MSHNRLQQVLGRTLGKGVNLQLPGTGSLASDVRASSRCQLLRLQTDPHQQIFIKRDDELSFGISGTKFRKYVSVRPHLEKLAHQIKGSYDRQAVVGVVGSAFSNNVLAALQVIRELNLKPRLFLRGPKPTIYKGNWLFSSLLIDNNHRDEEVRWFDRSAWESVDSEALASGVDYVLTEGAANREAVPGALTLADDIVQVNQREHGLTFDHIFVDAGTGLTASTLVAGFSLSDHDAQVHIVPVASESEEILVDRMERRYWPWILEFDASLVPLRDCNIRIHSLLHDRSFGSVSASLVSYIRSFAVRHGVLLDPIYSAKLFRHAEHVIQSEKLRGNILIIHSGGAQTLAGFDQFMQSTSYRV